MTFNQSVEPSRPWRIVTSADHSTVWDGEEALFDFNFLALGIDSDECFALADGRRLPMGKDSMVHRLRHFSEAACPSRLSSVRIRERRRVEVDLTRGKVAVADDSPAGREKWRVRIDYPVRVAVRFSWTAVGLGTRIVRSRGPNPRCIATVTSR